MDKKTTELVENIKQKFGSIARFCQVAELDPKMVRPALYRNHPAALENRKRIRKLADKLHDTCLPGELSPQQAEKLRVALATQYKFASHFYRAHPQFTPTFVSNVINKRVVSKCDRVQEMATILGIDLSK